MFLQLPSSQASGHPLFFRMPRAVQLRWIPGVKFFRYIRSPTHTRSVRHALAYSNAVGHSLFPCHGRRSQTCRISSDGDGQRYHPATAEASQTWSGRLRQNGVHRVFEGRGHTGGGSCEDTGHPRLREAVVALLWHYSAMQCRSDKTAFARCPCPNITFAGECLPHVT